MCAPSKTSSDASLQTLIGRWRDSSRRSAPRPEACRGAGRASRRGPRPGRPGGRHPGQIHGPGRGAAGGCVIVGVFAPRDSSHGMRSAGSLLPDWCRIPLRVTPSRGCVCAGDRAPRAVLCVRRGLRYAHAHHAYSLFQGGMTKKTWCQHMWILTSQSSTLSWTCSAQPGLVYPVFLRVHLSPVLVGFAGDHHVKRVRCVRLPQ